MKNYHFLWLKKVLYKTINAYYLLFIQILKKITFPLILLKFLIIIISKNMKLHLTIVKKAMVC